MRSNHGISTINGGGDCLVSGVFLDFESRRCEQKLGLLQEVVRVFARKQSQKAFGSPACFNTALAVCLDLITESTGNRFSVIGEI